MESVRCRSHLSSVLIIQTIFSIFLSIWHVNLNDATSTTPPPAFPGQTCNGLYNDSCVVNAFCNNTICQCNQTFYNNNNSCVSKVSLYLSCNQTGSCLDPNAECYTTCQCKSGFFASNGTCYKKENRNAAIKLSIEVPGEITDLAVTRSGSRHANVRWRRPSNPNIEILGYTVEVTPLNISSCISGVAVVCSNCNGTMPDISNCTKTDTKKQTHVELKSDVTWQEVNVTSLSPFVSYQVTVTAVNERGRGQETKRNFQTQSEAPTLDPNLSLGFNKSLLKDPEPYDITQTTAMLRICPCLVTDRSQGNITLAGLIVCNLFAGNCETSASDSNYFRSGIMTWKQFRKNGYKGSYRPTPDDWHETQHLGPSRRRRSTLLSRSMRETVSEIKYTLGDDVTCRQKNESVYCNGPLRRDCTFLIKVFACTAGGCKEADTGIIIRTLPTISYSTYPEESDGIVEGVLGALGALFLTVVIIVFFIQRRKRDSTRDKGETRTCNHTDHFRRTERVQMGMPSTERPSERRSTKLGDFKTRLALLHRDYNLHFKQEFQELCSSHKRETLQFTMRAGSKPVNRVKNRSQYALPYDHSLVVLTISNDSGHDYINASYIAGADSPCEYIATQAPLYSTLSDFWRMVYEHRTGVIVMLCDSVENGKKMVDPYWPDKINVPVRHGDLTVTMTGVSVLDVYTVRKMTVTMREQQDLSVTQLCIRGWSERGCSLPVTKLNEVIRVAGRYVKQASGPVIVHCNLGVGRTGIFIALDLLTRFVEKENLDREVNVYDVVRKMMGCRPNIIQTLNQYMLIHDVLGVIIRRKIHEASREATSHIVFQNQEHTINEYDELYELSGDEHIYSTLNEHQIK